MTRPGADGPAGERGGGAFGRAERLRDHGSIQRLFQGGKRIERPGFIVLWHPVPAGRGATAIVAGRRLGGSVVRNRARRRLREAYRAEKAVLEPRGVNTCIVARRPALTMPLAALRHDLAGALTAVITGRAS